MFQLIEFLARETLNHPEDFFVSVILFERDALSPSSSTLATIHLESSSSAQLSLEELVEEVLHFGDSGRIRGARVTGVQGDTCKNKLLQQTRLTYLAFSSSLG